MRVDTILANTNKNKQTATKCFLLEIKLSTRYFYIIIFLFLKFGAVKNKEEMAVRRGSGCGSIGYARNQNSFSFFNEPIRKKTEDIASFQKVI